MTIRNGFKKMFLDELNKVIDKQLFKITTNINDILIFTAETEKCRIVYYNNDSKIYFRSKNNFTQNLQLTNKLKKLMERVENGQF